MSRVATSPPPTYSDDPRAIRTRERIAEAVGAVTRAGQEVSVASLVRAAGVSRASFYAHYADIDELASSLLQAALQSAAEAFQESRESGPERFAHTHRVIVDHFVAHRAIYHAVSRLPVSKDGYLANVRFLASFIEPSLGSHPDAAPVAATARYVASAAYGLIDAWLTGEIPISDDELVERLTALLPPWYLAT